MSRIRPESKIGKTLVVAMIRLLVVLRIAVASFFIGQQALQSQPAQNITLAFISAPGPKLRSSTCMRGVEVMGSGTCQSSLTLENKIRY